MSDRPNILLVVLDSARAQNLGLHGYERNTSPALEEFASSATVFTQARAPSIHSIASHVSMFTGTHVEDHRATHHTARIDGDRSIWTELGGRGYATGLFTNNRVVSNASNLGEQFDHRFEPDYPLTNRLENVLGNPYVEQTYFRISDAWARVGGSLPSLEPLRRPFGRMSGAVGRQRAEEENEEGGFKTRHGGTFADGFLAWSDGIDGPWAACINLMDTHMPYRPESENDRWADEDAWRVQRSGTPSVRDTLAGDGWDRIAAREPLYDGTIRQADAIVGSLLDRLAERGTLSDTLVVVTSDHGEGFGERSRLDPAVRMRGHKWGIHEVLTHVPLVVQAPGQTTGRTVDDVVSLTDLPQLFRRTAEDAATGATALVTNGPVLASTFRLPAEKTTKFASVEGVDRFVGPWRAVYEMHDGTVRKYARHGPDGVTLDIDGAGAVTTVADTDDGRVAEVYGALEGSDVVTEAAAEIGEELEDQLRDLGYIR